MDTECRRSDDLNGLEGLLAACAPSTKGLDADAMLFEAGRASAKSSELQLRRRAPLIAVSAACVGFALGLAPGLDRNESRNGSRDEGLAHQSTGGSQSSVALSPPPTAAEWPRDSYLAARPALEKGLEVWRARSIEAAESTDSLPERDALRVRGLDELSTQ